LGALIARLARRITLANATSRVSALAVSAASPAASRVAADGDRAVRAWLFIVALLVFSMVVVGGATRLTESGLSITEWQPLLGAIPPLNEADWQAAFEKYKAIPEYSIVNAGMSVGDFKFIYWWEWTHRLLGRLIGVAFAIPFLAFWATGRLRPGLPLKLFGVLALGALQGFIGWYMVKSGLVDRIDVSQYRLALHLLIALSILSLLVWLALDAGPAPQHVRLQTVTRAERRFAAILFGLIFLQAGLGALVAGLKAGHTYNTWPLMDGRFVPEGLGQLAPWYLNVFENVTTVQFDHRMVAYLVVALALWHVVALRRSADDERLIGTAGLLAAVLLAQMGIGIATLLAGVPIALGLAHQAGAAIAIAAATVHVHGMTRAASRS
jgi:cytochrome c oxidase assembly protein subunit 15